MVVLPSLLGFIVVMMPFRVSFPSPHVTSFPLRVPGVFARDSVRSLGLNGVTECDRSRPEENPR